VVIVRIVHARAGKNDCGKIMRGFIVKANRGRRVMVRLASMRMMRAATQDRMECDASGGQVGEKRFHEFFPNFFV
jgi:hypothetical protein